MSNPEANHTSFHPTTTHAAWGTGHPRLLVAGEYHRFIHLIDCELTRVGSADTSDLVLPTTDPIHAKITHDQEDEYVLEMIGEGDTSHGRDATLRTGAQFTAGPWRLVFARDEYADHGRPYGGRNGGEFAHQRRQVPRPDYAHAHPSSAGVLCEVKPEELNSTPEQIRTIGQSVLVDASSDPPAGPPVPVQVVNDQAAGIYEALVKGREVGGVTYNTVGRDRMMLLAVSVFPSFRGRGIASQLIRAVLDDARANGKTVTNYCPVVATYIENNPGYADLIDTEHPGLYQHPPQP